MRLLLTILLIAIAAAVAEWFFPWWTAAVVAGAVVYVAKLSAGKAFGAGFCGIALLWLAFALYRDIPNHHILSIRMAQLFHLPGYSLFIAVTVFIGGIVGGIGAWSGAQLRKLLRPAAAV